MKGLKLLIFGSFVFLVALISYIIPADIITEKDLFPIIIIVLGTIFIIIGMLIEN